MSTHRGDQDNAPTGQNNTNGVDVHHPTLDELYESIKSPVENTELQKVLLSSSHPSPISLKLQGIKKILEDRGRMDIDGLNFAIRKLRREETIDRSTTNSQSRFWKYYISADFARYAISNKGALSGLETCVRNDFVDHHCAFGQDADLSRHYNSEVLCIPVVRYGSWSLYAFNLSDKKLSILDPTPRRKHHKSTRLKICKALEFAKDKFDLFRKTPDNFSNWRYEFTNLDQLENRGDEDTGFLVFNFMRHWDGHRLDQTLIPTVSVNLRKRFLEYIVSFNYNEAYGIDPRISQKVENLRIATADENASCLAWRRCKIDSELLKAVRQNDLHAFASLFRADNGTLLCNLCRGATSYGDGVLHIAARCGDLKLLRAIFTKVYVELSLEAIERRLQEGSGVRKEEEQEEGGGVQDLCVTVEVSNEERQKEFAELVRSRNHKGETCLHEAARRGDARFALALILADEEMGRKGLKASAPPLVQRADYEGVSPLYLATTLCCSDIVKVLLQFIKEKHHRASFSGPGGKTALHAAVLLNEELTQQLIDWMDNNDGAPDLRGMTDKSGNTPLHLVASAGRPVTAKLLLSATTCAALKKDSEGCLPIHVAAASGSLGVIKQLLEICPECIESRTASGQTFLHVAVEEKCKAVVRYVCSERSLARILNLTDQDGNTALHLAVKSGDLRVFSSLMGNPGVHLSLANREGRTPFDVASSSLEPGLKFQYNSRTMILAQLALSGAHYSACRRDVLWREIAGKLDKEKQSKTISKFAGLLAVCAILVLNMSVSTFFNVAKQNLTPTDPNIAAAAPTPAPALGAAKHMSAREMAETFKQLLIFDAIAFSSSALGVVCCTLAGVPIMDRSGRIIFLGIACLSVYIAFYTMMLGIGLAGQLAFDPVYPLIASVWYVLSSVALIPVGILLYMMLRFFAWPLFRRRFQKYFFARLC